MGDSDGTAWRVFISHTSELREFPPGTSYLAAVERAVSAAGHVIVDMADFPAADQPAAQVCAGRVLGCEVYIGVLGTRYGSPVQDRPEVSYTELEFDTATEARLDRLMFLLDVEAADVGIPLRALIDPDFGARQEAFRHRVRDSGLVTASFASPAALGQLVERSLRELARKRRGRGPRPAEGELRIWNIPAQLPHDVLGFTGRELELATLSSLTADQGNAAVVISAIDGIAGIGKTALAVHFAHSVAADFPDGQLFVNLRGFDPDQPPLAPYDALAGFLRALGADASQLPANPDELAAMYRSLLSGRRMLIVLDNAANADQVRPLLPGMPGCLAIVTSRNRLSGLVARDSAQRLTLDVLPPGEAIALIAQTAGAERIDADPAAASKLAQLCGWLPLALRITADRAAMHHHLTMTDLVDELAAEHDRLDALAADEKSAQIRAVFSWSYRALSPESALAFRLLGLHPGSDISVPAAAALFDAPPSETRQLLRTLTGVHLLEESGRDRYQFHDLVRVYAAECAKKSEPEPRRIAAVHRLIIWYMYTAQEFFRTLNPDNQHVPLDPPPPGCKPFIFTTNRQALDWAKSELANLKRLVRQAATVGDHTVAWKLPVTLLPVFAYLASEADLISALESALSVTRQLGDRLAETWVLNRLAEACLEGDRPAQAVDFSRLALAIATETGNSYGQHTAWRLKGNSHLKLRQLSEARDCLEQAVRVARKASDLRAEGLSLTWLGAVHEELGSPETAIIYREKAAAILEKARNRWQHAYAIQKLAEAYHHQERITDAINQYQRARDIFRELGDRRAEADTLVELGQAQRSEGQNDAARQSWHQALRIFEESGDLRADQVRTQLKDLSLQEGQPE